MRMESYFYEVLDDSAIVLACGSNLFGQIEPINQDCTNINVTIPRKIVDNKGIVHNCAENKTCVAKNVSTRNVQEKNKVNFCITWDRIICQYGKFLSFMQVTRTETIIL